MHLLTICLTCEYPRNLDDISNAHILFRRTKETHTGWYPEQSTNPEAEGGSPFTAPETHFDANNFSNTTKQISPVRSKSSDYPEVARREFRVDNLEIRLPRVVSSPIDDILIFEKGPVDNFVQESTRAIIEDLKTSIKLGYRLLDHASADIRGKWGLLHATGL